MSLETVYWRHDAATGPSGWPGNGLYTFSTGNAVGTQVKTFGGFAVVGGDALDDAIDLGSATDSGDAVGALPIVGMYFSDNPGNDSRFGVLAFAAPPSLNGATFQTHIWWTLEA
jgi:hypothetical protein